MADKILFYKGIDDAYFGYTIEYAITSDTCMIRPSTDIRKNVLVDLIDSLTYKYWEKYMLPNMEFDDSLSEEEVTHIKTVYNEFYLELNPDAILILPTSTDPQTAKKVALMYQREARKGTSALNLFCLDDIELNAGETGLIGFGIACEAGQSFWLMAKSDISQTTLRMSSGVNIIEKNYRGELMASVDNIGSTEFKLSGALTEPIQIRFLDSHGDLVWTHPEQPQKQVSLFQIALPDLREIRPVVTTFLNLVYFSISVR